MGTLGQRLTGKGKLTPRELRALWNRRLRPFWRQHIEMYRALAHRFLEHGDNYLASEVADEGAQFFGDDVALILTRALAAARSGAPLATQDLLLRKQGVLANAAEAKSLLARTCKDLWKASADRSYLEKAFEFYHLDYTTTGGDRTFPGVNAASMSLFLGRDGEAARIAGEVRAILHQRKDPPGYWESVTNAECLLVCRRLEEARAAYSAAAQAGSVPYAHLAATRTQARLLLAHLGGAEREFDECFPLPSIIAFTGHRVDAPQRPVPRFPEALAPAIKERIRESIVHAKAGFGYASAASGADILFLEVMQEAGLETYVHLPLSESEFIRQSVEDSNSPGWLDRYRAVTSNATEFNFSESEGPLVFDYGNRLLLGAACQHARQLDSEIRLLAVWDGRPGNGAGGTADCVAMAREAGQIVEVIHLDGADAIPAPAPPVMESADQLLAILTLSLKQDDQAEKRLAAIVARCEPVHREIAGARAKLFFRTPDAAAQAAETIATELGAQLTTALGLHAGPVKIGMHPLTGGRVIRGPHAEKSDEFAALDPSGVIYASSAFAALLALASRRGDRCEFLGYRVLRTGAPREPVFRLVS
ncbi:MAG: tetratricopeptide repeat-containing protein [Chthoniobacteraceae bacterium]